MSEQLDVLKLVAERLHRADLAYMMSGSMALNYYAQPRLTRDIDIVVALRLEDAARVTDLFAADFISMQMPCAAPSPSVACSISFTMIMS